MSPMPKIAQKIRSSGYVSNKEAIAEKVEQLTRVLQGEISEEELSETITKRRLEWLEENIDELKEKYRDLPPEKQAFRIIFLEHMNINPEDLRVTKPIKNVIRADGFSFCPYLEAYRQLGLDSRIMCKKINHDCFEKMAKMIHPNLVFYRNLQNLRPYSEYCEEYIELKEL